MPSYRKKPDRLEGLTQTKLLNALGTCRQAVISAQTQVKVAGPVYHGCQMVTSAIDALAHLITGSARYFHDQGTLGMPGEPNWNGDKQKAE
jgi:hypothetical protein